MDLENLKHTMNNLVTDMSALKKQKISKSSTGNHDDEGTSGTELNDSFESCASDESMVTPSAVSRTARNIVKANLQEGEIRPILSRTSKQLKSQVRMDKELPKRTSHRSYSQSNDMKLLKRRIQNLSRALQR